MTRKFIGVHMQVFFPLAWVSIWGWFRHLQAPTCLQLCSDNSDKLFHWAAEGLLCFRTLQATTVVARHYKWPAMTFTVFCGRCSLFLFWATLLNSGCISIEVLKLSWLPTACGAFIFAEIYEWDCNCGCRIVIITEVSWIYLCVYINSDYTCKTIYSVTHHWKLSFWDIAFCSRIGKDS